MAETITKNKIGKDKNEESQKQIAKLKKEIDDLKGKNYKKIIIIIHLLIFLSVPTFLYLGSKVYNDVLLKEIENTKTELFETQQKHIQTLTRHNEIMKYIIKREEEKKRQQQGQQKKRENRKKQTPFRDFGKKINKIIGI